MSTWKMNLWLMCFMVVIFISPIPAAAQQENQQAVHLDEVVVTATKTEKEIKNTPASISVIKADTLDSSPNMTLDEAFRYTPSVQIIRGEGVATVHNFTSIRGVGDSRNLLYVDGVNMVESMSGNTNLSLLPTAGVERIEILRGPSSALYGGRGMSGVINIMTKTPEAGWHGSFKPSFGNYDYRKYQGTVSYGSEPFSVSLALSDTQTDNYWSRDTIIRRDYDYRTGDYSYDYFSDYESEGHEGWEHWNRDYEENALRSKIQFRPSDNLNLAIVGGTMNNETGNGYTDRYTDGAGNDVEKYLEKSKDYIGLMGDANFGGKSKLAFRLTYHKPEYTNFGENMDLALSLDDPAQLAPGGRAPQFYRSKSNQGSKDYEAELKWSLPVSHQGLGEHLVTVGAEYLRNDIYWSIEEEGSGRALTPEVDLTKDAWSLYLQDEYFINAKWTLTAGLRGDFYDDFDDQVSPKVSLLYKHDPSTQYFLSGGYAYNPPAYSDKFGTDWNMTAYTVRTNNSDLDAEKLKSVELGARKSIADKFNGSLTAYYTEADDLIESIKERREIGGAGSRVYMTYEYHANIDRATMKGIESEFNYDIAANHRISGNLTYMEAKNEETDQRLERSPTWLGSIAYNYSRPFDRYRLWTTLRGRGQDGIYIGEYSVDEPREVSGFFVVDVSLGFDIGKYFSVFGDVTNLFDADYREFTFTRYQPGRVWLIGCEIKM
jgi:outer membrane receptor for ferrienterochelin and colicin